LFIALVVIALIVGVILAREELFPDPLPPVALSPLPAPGRQITRIFEPDWSDVQPELLAVDGLLYYLSYTDEGQGWRNLTVSSEEKASTTWPCDDRTLNHLAAAGEPIRSCLTARTFGEWCPGDHASYAVTDSGRVWALREPQPCPMPLILMMVVWVPIALLITAVVAIIWQAIQLRRRAAPR
jgi:hypothetical protein